MLITHGDDYTNLDIWEEQAMGLEEIGGHLDEIERILEERVVNLRNGHELKNKKEKFRARDNSISRLSTRGIPIPDEMKNMKETLITEIEGLSMPIEDVQKIYNRTLKLVVKLGRLCRRSPRKDLYLKDREERKNETDIDTIGKALVSVLEKMGGSGKEKSIIPRVEEDLRESFTESDLTKPSGNRPKWQSNLRRARKKLIGEGILTTDSKGSRWTLVR